MRFTWIALPVLFVTLASHGTTAAVTKASGAVPDAETATNYVASSSELPVAILPTTSGETRMARLGSDAASHHDASLDRKGDPLGARSASVVCARFRNVNREGLGFIQELNRATTGFLSSSTTACPPPASR